MTCVHPHNDVIVLFILNCLKRVVSNPSLTSSTNLRRFETNLHNANQHKVFNDNSLLWPALKH